MSVAMARGRAMASDAEGRPIEACSQGDPDLMFPDGEDVENDLPNDHPLVMAAKAVCGGCGLRDLCLEGAVARRERWGVWGGLNYREREALRRRRSRADHRAAVMAASVVGANASPGSRAAEWAEQLELFEVSA